MENEDLDLQNRQAPSEKSAMGSLLHQAKAYENDEELAELKAVYANGRKAETLPEFKTERILTFLATDETPDRAGDIVRVDGGDVKRFMQNPVFLVQHRDLPVARVLSFKKIKNSPTSPDGKAWIAKVYFPEDDEDSVEIFTKYMNGTMSAVSIGFRALKVNRPEDPGERQKIGLGPWGYEVLSWELLELSAAAVPCNPNALRQKSAQGVTSKEFAQLSAMIGDALTGIKSIAEKLVIKEAKPESNSDTQSETVESLEKHFKANPLKLKV